MTKLSVQTVSCVALVLSAATTIVVQAQTYNALYNFTGSSDGGRVYGAVVRDKSGTLYGTGQIGGVGVGVVYKLDPTTGQETVLHTFAGAPTDGAFPTGPLLRNKDGSLYGTTAYGGQSNKGTIFKIDKKGNETILYNFVGGATDGCTVVAGLIRDKSGNFYGTTEQCGSGGFGTVFKLDTSGNESVIHSFTDSDQDGATPYFGNLLIDNQGSLYGATLYGGSDRTCLLVNDGHCLEYDNGHGVLYTLSASGTFSVLQNFGNYVAGDGDGFPMGTPIIDTKGNIYGTSYGCDPESGSGHVWSCTSGSYFAGNNAGVVWERISDGTYKVLYGFNHDGPEASPIGGVVMDSKGNLYGTTEYAS
jgi:uncharacterized repeat protein (TIGR03803 family)